MKRTMIDLGWCMARIELADKKNARLTISSPSLYDEASSEPAQSILIYGNENVAKLRDALIEFTAKEPQ